MQTSKLTHCSLLQSSPMQNRVLTSADVENRVLTSADVEIVGFKREPATPKKSQIRVRLPSVSTTTDHNGLINLYSALDTVVLYCHQLLFWLRHFIGLCVFITPLLLGNLFSTLVDPSPGCSSSWQYYLLCLQRGYLASGSALLWKLSK